MKGITIILALTILLEVEVCCTKMDHVVETCKTQGWIYKTIYLSANTNLKVKENNSVFALLYEKHASALRQTKFPL